MKYWPRLLYYYQLKALPCDKLSVTMPDKHLELVGELMGRFRRRSRERAHRTRVIDEEDVVVLKDQVKRGVGWIADQFGALDGEELYTHADGSLEVWP